MQALLVIIGIGAYMWYSVEPEQDRILIHAKKKEAFIKKKKRVW